MLSRRHRRRSLSRPPQVPRPAWRRTWSTRVRIDPVAFQPGCHCETLPWDGQTAQNQPPTTRVMATNEDGNVMVGSRLFGRWATRNARAQAPRSPGSSRYYPNMLGSPQPPTPVITPATPRNHVRLPVAAATDPRLVHVRQGEPGGGSTFAFLDIKAGVIILHEQPPVMVDQRVAGTLTL